jgi:hypothetical protein
VPVNRSRWAYGMLPPRLARLLADRIIERMRLAKLKIVKRPPGG